MTFRGLHALMLMAALCAACDARKTVQGEPEANRSDPPTGSPAPTSQAPTSHPPSETLPGESRSGQEIPSTPAENLPPPIRTVEFTGLFGSAPIDNLVVDPELTPLRNTFVFGFNPKPNFGNTAIQAHRRAITGSPTGQPVLLIRQKDFGSAASTVVLTKVVNSEMLVELWVGRTAANQPLERVKLSGRSAGDGSLVTSELSAAESLERDGIFWRRYQGRVRPMFGYGVLQSDAFGAADVLVTGALVRKIESPLFSLGPLSPRRRPTAREAELLGAVERLIRDREDEPPRPPFEPQLPQSPLRGGR